MLPFWCAALSACSLINAYDDVKGSGGTAAGGAPEGGSGAGAPGGGPEGGAGGEGTGGEGGTPQIVVTCAVNGDPFVVEDLSAAPPGQRTYDRGSFGYQPNGDQVRVFLRVQQELRAMEINVGDEVVTSTFETPVQELMWARPVGANTFGLLVGRQNVGAGYPLDLLVWPGNSNLQNPTVYPISAGALTNVSSNTPRGLFVHAGNEPDNIRLLLRSFEGGNHQLRYARHVAGVPVETSTTIGLPAADEEQVSPRSLVRTNDAMMHAFVGSPSMSGTGGTKQWVFPENANTIAGPATDIGPQGAIMIDASRKQDGTVNIAVGQISATSLKLKGDNVTEANLATIDTADFNTLVELNSFLDVHERQDGDDRRRRLRRRRHQQHRALRAVGRLRRLQRRRRLRHQLADLRTGRPRAADLLGAPR
jgi:hypothetical protein